jgi:ankyrin repeat protein
LFGLTVSALLCMGKLQAQSTSFEFTYRPLIQAIDRGDLARVEALLASGADPNDHGRDHFAAVHAAAAKGNTRIAKALLRAGADINLRDKHLQERTPLFYAVEWGLLEMVQFILANGGAVNAKTRHGYSALHMATEPDGLPVLRVLVKSGADINATAENDTTVLQAAIQNRNSEAVAYLLELGADPEARTYRGMTVVSDAVMAEDEEILRLLLKRGVSLSVTDDSKGYTPLHYAAASGNRKIVEMLLAAGADPSTRTKHRELPEDIAREAGDDAVADVLNAARLSAAGNDQRP